MSQYQDWSPQAALDVDGVVIGGIGEDGQAFRCAMSLHHALEFLSRLSAAVAAKIKEDRDA